MDGYELARHFGDDIEFKAGGVIETRAKSVLSDAVRLLDRVAATGLMASIQAKTFADVSRTPQGGRGYDGVIERSPDYWNPFEDALRAAPAGIA